MKHVSWGLQAWTARPLTPPMPSGSLCQVRCVICCVYCCSQSNNHSMSSQPLASQQQYESQDDANMKKKRDRFKGMSEDDVLMRMLPDHLVPSLDIVIVSH